MACIAAAYTLTNLFLLPESPRWLVRRGRTSDAERVWDLLGVKREDREVEPEDAPIQGSAFAIQDPTQPEAKTKKHAGFRDLWKRNVRKQAFPAVFLMGFLQLREIDAYAPMIFQQAGLKSQEASFLASGVSAIVILVTGILATLYADKWGRRTSTLVGGLGLTATMVLISGLYAGQQVVIVTIYIYCVIQATTWAISIKVWAPEIQTQHTRAQATSLASVSFNWVCNFIMAFICPIFLAKSAPSAYLLFGRCTAVGTIVSFFYMVETKGKSLDEIERAFKKRLLAADIMIARPSLPRCQID
ncbi:general substrate transporter [Phialemonium atrogriseum]|uniref:General substrate transporter n=1 Tax=Phialemonium atrogriseum TaxID=1093897 RepID=A0AAJ0BQP5_9PEZI|nr:general substrate transporter [Phialemonium atrogriseum]KAK1762287.1 general substrate transporter [Phialemonium atrogriseum]